jgi:rare lipoprotein A (peptidoglycan hydrolase)
MHAKHRKRIIDVSRGVAEYLDMIRAGVVLVRVAPLKDSRRSDHSCAAAFESRDMPPDSLPAMDWRDQQTEPQLDAMH